MIKSSNCSWVSIKKKKKRKSLLFISTKDPSKKIKFKFILLSNFRNDLYNALTPNNLYSSIFTFLQRISRLWNIFLSTSHPFCARIKKSVTQPDPRFPIETVSPPKKFNPPPISTWKSRDTGYITQPTCRKFRGGVTKPPPLRNTFVAIVKFNGN